MSSPISPTLVPRKSPLSGLLCMFMCKLAAHLDGHQVAISMQCVEEHYHVCYVPPHYRCQTGLLLGPVRYLLNLQVVLQKEAQHMV